MRTGNAVYLILGAVILAGGIAVSILIPRIGSSVATSSPQETKKMIQSKIAESKSGRVETAVFGAGCFWGVEAAFRSTPGVLATAVGYEGGTVVNPTYDQVCTDTTGHAEVVQVEFDPGQITYEQLLDVFWTNHNPTQLNFQGPDYGRQYRTVIFTFNDAQKQTAEASKAKLAASGKFSRPIATEITPHTTFFPAEGYHQQYLEKRGKTHCHL
jgi:peptide-methionine (S)-S-oxide reductase